MSEIKNGGLDQYGAEPFERQQFGTAGVERVKFELGRDFRIVHLPPKFHHPMFTRSEVIVLTNKRTNRRR